MCSGAEDLKEKATRQAKARLRAFLDANTLLALPQPIAPRLSILLVLFNRAELTLACLQSLHPRLEAVGAEIVLVDNASSDETPELLERLQGATVLRNRDNRGFPAAVNQAAAAARGEFLLLLNNDTEVLGDSLATALRFLEANRDVGAVGGRIILLDGALQEAGCGLWRDGHPLQYGRGDSPTAAEHLFQRDVDYCSGAFLMTPAELFHKLGGLDESFSPGYFEDVDYCVRLWRAGWRVVYLPDAAIVHYENASSGCSQALHALYRRNHLLFTQKHADWLALQGERSGSAPLWMRSSHDDRFKVLYLPRSDAGALAPGPSPSLSGVIRQLRSLNCFLTVYPVGSGALSRDLALGLPPDVEFLPGSSLDALPRFLTDRRGYYDCLVASDPEILERARQHLRASG